MKTLLLKFVHKKNHILTDKIVSYVKEKPLFSILIAKPVLNAKIILIIFLMILFVDHVMLKETKLITNKIKFVNVLRAIN